MIDDVWLLVLAGIGIGAVLTILVQLVWRLARGTRDLGSDAERATFRTLSLASRAAVHLRGGLDTGDLHRASRALRTLLGSDAIAIADTRRIVSVDGRPRPLDRGVAGGVQRDRVRSPAGAHDHPGRGRRSADRRQRAGGRRDRRLRRQGGPAARARHHRGRQVVRGPDRARRAPDLAHRARRSGVARPPCPDQPALHLQRAWARSRRTSAPTRSAPRTWSSTSRTSPGTRSGDRASSRRSPRSSGACTRTSSWSAPASRSA